jgi:hypothetical protein
MKATVIMYPPGKPDHVIKKIELDDADVSGALIATAKEMSREMWSYEGTGVFYRVIMEE